MKKKLFFVSVLALAILVISGCMKSEYKVTFNSNGGSSVSSQTVEKNDTVTEPARPVREGYAFQGWYEGNEEFDFDTKITKDLTLTAKWEEIEEVDAKTKYTVTFDTDGGSSVSDRVVAEDSLVSKPLTPIKEGYTFKEWTLDRETFDFNTKITKDITLVAKWEKDEVEETPNSNGSSSTPGGSTTPTVTKYTVTFNSDGGSKVTSKTVNKGSKVLKPTNPTKSGYTFNGWTLNGKAYNFNNAVNKNITLKATWKAVPKEDKYTVEQAFFQTGSPQVKVIVKKNGSVITASEVISSDNKKLGWYNSEHSTILVDATAFNAIAKIKLNNGTIVNVSK